MFQETQVRETKIPSFWRFGEKVMGLDENVAAYLKRLPVTLPPFPELFEAGCGAGTVSFAALARWQNSHYVATDTDGRMLLAAARRALKENVPPQRLELGEADPNNPAEVTFLNRDEPANLRPESFDMAIASAALERSDLEASIPVLLRLVKPGGYLVDIGVRDSFAGRIAASLTRISIVPERTLLDILALNDCNDVARFPFAKDEFPASLFLDGWIARKKK